MKSKLFCSSIVVITIIFLSFCISASSIALPDKTFTLNELSKYNGQNNMPAYVAIDGVVYDVSGFKKWANGKHFKGHTAGKDLSHAIRKAPHGIKRVKILKVVGKLKK